MGDDGVSTGYGTVIYSELSSRKCRGTKGRTKRLKIQHGTKVARFNENDECLPTFS